MTFTTPAIVLRHADYGESDRMVTLLSPERGRLDVAAKGCRKVKSQIVSATELFVSGEYVLNDRNGRLFIEGCQISDSFYDLRTDYDKLTHGVYWLKLLDAYAQQDAPANDEYVLILKALSYLNYSSYDISLLTFAFEAHMMKLQGISPRVDSCVVCGRPLDAEARFDARRGGATCVNCSSSPRISYGARRILYRLPNTPYESVEKLDGHENWREAAKLMREYVKLSATIPQKFFPNDV